MRDVLGTLPPLNELINLASYDYGPYGERLDQGRGRRAGGGLGMGGGAGLGASTSADGQGMGSAAGPGTGSLPAEQGMGSGAGPGDSASPEDQARRQGAIEATLGYAGMFYHARSGLYLTHYRAYDPRLGRWLSRDPIWESGGINLYGYVGGDPVGWVDPYGLLSIGDLPNIPQPVIDLTTGIADAASLGLGPLARQYLDLEGDVNMCSTSYLVGQWMSLALGGGRVLYASIAKFGAAAAADAAGAVAFRNTLKRIMRGPLAGSSFRIKSYAELMDKYGSEDAIKAAAGRTNQVVNSIGINSSVGSVVDQATCSCQK